MTNKTGGPIFPCKIPTGGIHKNDEPAPTKHHFGITLRDYFAAKSISSVLLPNPVTGQFPQVSDFEACATAAYAMADAMLQARGVKDAD